MSRAEFPHRRFAWDITGSPSSSESVDKERLIGDSNKLPLSRGRKGVPEGDAWVSVFRSAPRARLGFLAVVVAAVVALLPSSDWDVHCFWVGLFEENLQISVLASFYRYRLLASHFAF